jgi:cell division protein FtsI/penicillin-binding protein 2
MPPTATTIPVAEDVRLDALEVVGEFMEAILARDGVAVARLGTDPPATIQEDLDIWATAIGLDAGSYTVTAERFTTTAAEIDVRLDLRLIEVGQWSYTTTVTLVGGDPWQILWSPGVLHPSLEPGDVLRVDRQWPARAAILARDGTELAGAEQIKIIGVVPAWIEDLDRLTDDLARLAQIEPNVVIQEITNPIVQPDWFVPVGTIKEVVHLAVGDEIDAIPGVLVRDGTERLPFRADFAAHLVGTTGAITAEQLDGLGFPYGPTDTIGQTGIEAAYETTLAGRPRTAIVRVNKFGRVVEDLLIVEAIEPESVRTTIDIDVQTAIERSLRDDERPLAVVVLDAPTGHILGAASRPLSSGFDRAISGAYPPGSTFKVVTATALLEHGYSASTEVECPGRVTLGGRAIRNAGNRDLGTIDFTEAFAQSCNTTFAAATVADLDSAILLEAASRFGFDIPAAVGVPAADPSFPAPADIADLAASAIGQARILASPVHMASVAGAVAAGVWRPPTVIFSAERPTGIELERSAVSTLTNLMRSVVTSGTGQSANVPGVVVHGKTGSAEFGVGDDIGTHAWFIGWWGDYAIAVVVEGGGGGGSVAAPIAAEIISELSG